MTEILQSIFLGLSALHVVAFTALVLTFTRLPRRSDPRALGRLAVLAAVIVVLQAGHFLEELTTGFHEAFPVALGLAPWPRGSFIAFNVFWPAIWLLSLPGLVRAIRPAFFPIWFLGIGMVLNGVAHPILALRVGGYFPGLVTSPVLGLLGAWLLVRLGRALAAAEQPPASPVKAIADREIYFPGTEDLGRDEMGVTACGTGMPNARPKQAAACWLVELGNGDKFLFDIGTGSAERISALQ